MAPVLFNCLFLVYAIFYFPYLILTGRYYEGYDCRFGSFPDHLKKRLEGSEPRIWIHAVSVGEIMAIMPFVNVLKSRYPNHTLVVTVTTKTGYELAKNKLAASAVVIPSPLDFTWVVSSFVQLIKPKIYIAAETEIWPNLFNCLSKKKVPIAIINGRISDRSFGRYQAIKSLLKDTLEKVNLFCVQSAIDAKRMVEIGAPPLKVVTAGNIKFDDVPMASLPSAGSVFFQDKLIWVAGSTHPGEEEIILNIFKRYQETCSLVIAPRHVERSEQILTLAQSKGLKAIRYSQIASGLNPDTVIVVDTIGQLRSLYAQASLVFVGKSLCVGGGHNIIEPAVYAKPMIIGSMMENFRDVTALFNAREAIIQVKTIEEFEKEVGRLINDEGLRRQLGQRAFQVVEENQGAVSRTVKLLEPWI